MEVRGLKKSGLTEDSNFCGLSATYIYVTKLQPPHSWPDGSTGGVIHQQHRCQGLSPCVGLNFSDFSCYY